MSGFVYAKCPVCRWSEVLKIDIETAPEVLCSRCLDKGGHRVPMDAWPAEPEDVPTGRDERNNSL